jgi:hypothetical protein
MRYAHSEVELELLELVRMDGAMEAVGLGQGGELARPAASDAPRRDRGLAGRDRGTGPSPGGQRRRSGRPAAGDGPADARRRDGQGLWQGVQGVAWGMGRCDVGSRLP